MKLSETVILLITLGAAYGYEWRPRVHMAIPPDHEASSSPKVIDNDAAKSFGEFLYKLSLANILRQRCGDILDENCVNVVLSSFDETWFGSPRKRCANLFDEGCANGGINGAGRDEGWLSGGNNPGKR